MKVSDCCNMNATSEFQVCFIITLCQSMPEPQSGVLQFGRTKGFLPKQFQQKFEQSSTTGVPQHKTLNYLNNSASELT